MPLRDYPYRDLVEAGLLGAQLDGILTYDARLAEAAQSCGIRIFDPA